MVWPPAWMLIDMSACPLRMYMAAMGPLPPTMVRHVPLAMPPTFWVFGWACLGQYRSSWLLPPLWSTTIVTSKPRVDAHENVEVSEVALPWPRVDDEHRGQLLLGDQRAGAGWGGERAWVTSGHGGFAGLW